MTGEVTLGRGGSGRLKAEGARVEEGGKL